jgi:hypothetical protein
MFLATALDLLGHRHGLLNAVVDIDRVLAAAVPSERRVAHLLVILMRPSDRSFHICSG